MCDPEYESNVGGSLVQWVGGLLRRYISLREVCVGVSA